MTRKDYVKLATVIRFERDNTDHNLFMVFDQDTVFRLACRLADMLKLDNPRFNRDRFLKDCGF